MSDTRYKDLHQGFPQREVIRGKKKVISKPFQVERRHPSWPKGDWCPYREWRKVSRFATRELTENYIEKEFRSVHTLWFKTEYRPEFRIIKEEMEIENAR